MPDVSGYAGQYADANTPQFQQQVQMALVSYCGTVITELTSVTNHAVRVAHATAILASQATLQKYVQLYALFAVAAESAVYETTTDAQMLTAVTAIFTANCAAGANPVF